MRSCFRLLGKSLLYAIRDDSQIANESWTCPDLDRWEMAMFDPGPKTSKIAPQLSYA